MQACSSSRWILKLCSFSIKACRAQDTRLKTVLPTLSYCLNLSTSPTVRGKEKSQKDVDIAENAFFEKYKEKIQHVQISDPGEFEERLKCLSEKRYSKEMKGESTDQAQNKTQNAPQTVLPTDIAKTGAGLTKPHGLDSVMKLDLIKDNTTDEIIQIWNQYHSGKNCVYSVLKKSEFENLMVKSKECPVFVYPLPRDGGFEFILSQFDSNDVYFTPLSMFQLVRENAPPCLTVNHYTELMDEKGIVLMTGQYDDKLLKQGLALSLVQQMSIFYGISSKFYDIVHKFNYQPENFAYQELIDALKTLPQHDMR